MVQASLSRSTHLQAQIMRLTAEYLDTMKPCFQNLNLSIDILYFCLWLWCHPWRRLTFPFRKVFSSLNISHRWFETDSSSQTKRDFISLQDSWKLTRSSAVTDVCSSVRNNSLVQSSQKVIRKCGPPQPGGAERNTIPSFLFTNCMKGQHRGRYVVKQRPSIISGKGFNVLAFSEWNRISKTWLKSTFRVKTACECRLPDSGGKHSHYSLCAAQLAASFAWQESAPYIFH